ncbi:MAG: RtcB family protein [Bradymonadia bacterium]
MSLKYSTDRVSDQHHVLPKRGNMCCDVHAFLSDDLFDRTDEGLWQQAAQAASYPGAKGLYLMPDCHIGYGIPVGGVLVTDGTLVQAGSGYDISCGVVYMRAPTLHASDLVEWSTRSRWVDAVEQRVATGVGNHRPPLARGASKRKVNDILRYGARALGVSSSLCERHYIEVPEHMDLHRIPKAYQKARPQLGSVGGGNHFIELQIDEADGSVWVMVHCGSRGYGWQTANHFFYEGARLRGLPAHRREESWLYIDEPMGQRYWAYHNSAANYAIANRHTIVQRVREATREALGADLEVYYEISHNLVQEETLLLPGGGTTQGFVHRKGATRAFPAGHPALKKTKWEKTGHPILIPGSMLAGAAILFPKHGATRSGNSVNHGSGRHLSRSAAKKELKHRHDEIDHEMRTLTRTLGGVRITGIVGNTDRTPLDECGHVYKDLDAVLQVLVDEGIAEVSRRLYPVANIKGVN